MKRKLTSLLRQMIIQKLQCKQLFSDLQNLKQTSQQAGFTLMELLVVMFIIAALSVPALMMHQRVKSWMHKQEFYSNAKHFEKVAQAHYSKMIAERRAVYEQPDQQLPEDFNFIPVPSDGVHGAVQGPITATDPQTNTEQTGNFYTIGTFIGPGFRRISGTSVHAPGYSQNPADRRSWFSDFSDLKDAQNLIIDGWKQPTLVVVFVPASPSQGSDYCPLRDNSTPKILYVSSGRNTEFALDPTDAESTLHPSRFVGPLNEVDTHNKPFNFDGSWNKRWNPNSWSSGKGRTKNENLYYKISFESLDQKYYDESLKTLRAIETNLKNSFYSKIVGHMELPTPDPWPTLEGNCNIDQTDARGLFLQPTRGNWFAINSDGCPFDEAGCDFNTERQANETFSISPTTLSLIARMSPSEATDAWGNRILWDPSVEGNGYRACSVLAGDAQLQAQIPSRTIVYNTNDSNFVHSPYAARIFSSCGYALHERVYSTVLGTLGGDGSSLWPRSDDGLEVFDNNLIITVPGMY